MLLEELVINVHMDIMASHIVDLVDGKKIQIIKF